MSNLSQVKLFGNFWFFIFFVWFCLSADLVQAKESVLAAVDLKVNGLKNPQGINPSDLNLSWQLSASYRGAQQSAYQIQVVPADKEFNSQAMKWDTGKVQSSASLYIPYRGDQISSREKVKWRVRVWDRDNLVSDWSEVNKWSTGLINDRDWQAKWITAQEPHSIGSSPVTYFQKEVVVRKKIKEAIIYVSSLGIYELNINGEKVGKDLFTPGWTDYNHRVQYQTYDVSNFFTNEKVVLQGIVADGWYRGFLGWEGQKAHYGTKTALIAQLHLLYEDGSEQIVTTDDTWKYTTNGTIQFADIYKGEFVDATASSQTWKFAQVLDKTVNLVEPESPPVREIEILKPQHISRLTDDSIIVDFGQNFVGKIRLSATVPKGTEILIEHAEVLDELGDIYKNNLRSAVQEDRYIFSGIENETYSPTFTFHGFRYAKVSGLPPGAEYPSIEGVVIHSDLANTAEWTSSSKLLNQLYSNIIWGQKSNFLEVPTDCPQRDERLGWTGDAQVFAATAAINMDVSGFFKKWLTDLSLSQKESGSVPHVVPDILDEQHHGTAGWGDAATIIPWQMYLAYGDESFLKRQFNSMKAWVDYISTQVDDDLIWRPGFQYGDWLAPLLNDSLTPYRAETGTDFIATAFYARSVDILSRSARIIGDENNHKQYAKLFKSIKEAFNQEFVTDSGLIVYNTQTAYVLALNFDLLDEHSRMDASSQLVRDISKRGNHLTTGFLGTSGLTKALSENNKRNTAYKLLNQTTYPSWLYPVTFGATTIWERWDAIKPDGSFQNPEMTSFNHYAYGAIGQWMMTTVAGIQIDENAPGYKVVILNPQPGGELTNVKASIETPYGKVLSSWRIQASDFTYEIEIPANTVGKVILPFAKGATITEDSLDLSQVPSIYEIEYIANDVHLTVGSGDYTFSYESIPLALQAADISPITDSTTLFEAAGVTEIQNYLKENGPQLLSPWAIRTIGDKSLSEISASLHTDNPIANLIKQLPTINENRKHRAIGVK